jgi:hypothetical protein
MRVLLGIPPCTYFPYQANVVFRQHGTFLLEAGLGIGYALISGCSYALLAFRPASWLVRMPHI